MKLKNLKLAQKFSILCALLIVLGIAITCSFGLRMVKSEFLINRDNDLTQHAIGLQDLLQGKGPLKVVDGKLFAGGTVLNGNVEIPGKMKKIFGGVATIVLGDTRIATNVLQPDGSPAVGTKIDTAVAQTVQAGKPYRGDVKVLGEDYFGSYEPLKDAAGQVIGATFVGVRNKEYEDLYHRMLLVLGGLGLGLAIALSVASYYIIRRTLRPLEEMVKVNEALAAGDLSVTIPEAGADEVGQLAGSARVMESQLSSMIATIRTTAAEVASSSTILAAASEGICTSAEGAAAQISTVAGVQRRCPVSSCNRWLSATAVRALQRQKRE